MAKRRKTHGWRIQIVRTATVPASSLLANEWNARIHPQLQRDALAGLLDEVGVVQFVLVNLRTAVAWGERRGVETVVDGHLRILIALGHGDETPVPVAFVDLSPQEERRVLLTYDRIGALATLDAEKIVVLREETLTDYPESTLDLDAVLRTDRRRVSFETETAYNVLVACVTEEDQASLIERLRGEGWMCKATARS